MKRDTKKALYESIMLSVAKQVKKALNESFQSDDELRNLVIKFKKNINPEEFYSIAFQNEEVDPSLQRIINVYDPYVEEIIEIMFHPDFTYYEKCDKIKAAAENNEWETGTESDMVVNFLYDLYDWCEQHDLVNENN